MTQTKFKLNKQQQKAVLQTKGRLLILAGAGSGKTRVIVHRIAHLIEDKKVAPTSILGLTFTNKAAKEMKERIAKMIDPILAKHVFLSTFHSFCMHVLRRDGKRIGFSSSFSLYDERDMQRLLSSVLHEMHLTKEEIPSPANLYAAISHTKNRNLSSKDIPSLGSKEEDKYAKDIYEKLNQTLRSYNAMDFDSLLSLCVELFEKCPDVLAKYQDKYRYIMIDEYQDTNPIQDRLAHLLADKYNNLCVVGDDDQSIYGWRGAVVDNIIKFKADTTIKLEQNYRSYPNILSAANSVIQNNKNRHDKLLWTAKEKAKKIGLFHAPTEEDEATAVIDRIIQLKKSENLKWKDFAILYRSNALSRNFEMALVGASWKKDDSWVRGIPYEVIGGLEFSERSEIKDLMAYLKFISNLKDKESLLRIINVPRRGISTQTLLTLTEIQKKEKKILWKVLEKVAQNPNTYQFASRSVKGIQSFVQIIQQARKRFASPPLFSSLKWLIDAINYKKAIEEEVKSEKARQIKLENAHEAINALAQYEKENPNPSLQDFISNTLLSKENLYKQKESFGDDKVRLITFHSAKGLEFPICFIIGVEDHIIPHEKSLMDTGLEEERRLFYVAITRAMKHLNLSMARKRKRSGKDFPTTPSRFLSEIPKDLLEISSWKVY